MTELGDNHVCNLQALGAGPWVTGAGGRALRCTRMVQGAVPPWFTGVPSAVTAGALLGVTSRWPGRRTLLWDRDLGKGMAAPLRGSLASQPDSHRPSQQPWTDFWLT